MFQFCCRNKSYVVSLSGLGKLSFKADTVVLWLYGCGGGVLGEITSCMSSSCQEPLIQPQGSQAGSFK